MIFAVVFGSCLTILSVSQAQAPIEVEPSEIVTRPELVGREIVIDDRIKIFFPKSAGGYDIYLRRTPVVIRLPSAFQFRFAPSQKAVRVRGTLRQEGKEFYLDATAKPDLFADDLKRLRAEIAVLVPGDSKRLAAWADWAMRRAKAFDDDSLREEAVTLHTKAVALDLDRPETRSAEGVLALARRAREKGVPEPEPSALAHLAFRLRMTSAKTPADLDALAKEIGAFLPPALWAPNADPKRKFDVYDNDPALGYRQANEEGRKALDRRLWSDVVTESLKRRAAKPDQNLDQLAEEARTLLPDHPEVAGGFHLRSLEALLADIPKLRKAKLLELERTLREELNQPDRARAIVQTWLESKKKAIRPTSADAHSDLARDYQTMLNDKATAADLLRIALKIDPDSQDASDQLQRMGFVKTKGEWLDPKVPVVKAPDATQPERPSSREDTFVGLTPAEVKAQLGEPKRISRIASQGRISLQWTYETARGTQFIDFLQKLGESQPTVTGRYAIH